MAFRYAVEGKHEESARLLQYIKEIADQQSDELREVE